MSGLLPKVGPDDLYRHLATLVDAASAEDMVRFKHPGWKPTFALKRAPVKSSPTFATPVPDRLVWRTNYVQNNHHYPRAAEALRQKQEVIQRVVNRDPCFKCGTRADIGCKHTRAQWKAS